MQGRRNDVQQPITGQRPPFRHSPQSMSLPSTPNHHPRHLNGVSRSPSPPTCMLDSPRSAASEPASTTPYSKAPTTGCLYETLLIDARRRMPYSLGIDKLAREKPKLENLPQSQEEALTEDIEKEFERLKPSSESEIRRRKFLGKLSRILNEEWPGHDTKVHAFGSTENHLCMDDSDVDVCITTKCKEVESTCKLAAALAKRGMERIVCVPGAKVPIVKIWDPEYKVACDMNVNSTLALDNTRMIKTYVEIDDRVRPLALIIKHWTKQRILNNAAIGGTLSSYTWICMILNFLQTREPPVLPSLHMLPHERKPPNHGVDVSFADDIEALRGWGKDNHETLGELLFAFFKKYGHDMDYETTVLSVRAGKLLSKEEKGWQFLQNNRLCVEEPFNTGRNLGNTADDCSMRGIHLEFRRAHKILAEKADLAGCCERYEFPPEEVHHVPPPQAPSRPVTLSRSNSNHGRNRNGGYSSGNQRGGGRAYHQYNNNRNNQNRRGSSGAAAFNQNLLQSQYYSHTPEMFSYLPTAHDQLVAIQAQIQVHAHAQAQLAHAAQVHAQNQLQNQHQNGSPSASSMPTNRSANSHEGVSPYISWPYIAHLYGLNMFYPLPMGQSTSNSDTSTGPTSPPHTPGMVDGRSTRGNDASRLGLGRGGRAYSNGSRSQSQPPPLYSGNGYSRNMPTVGVASSEDDEFGDHSSNGNPPETPPEEEPDEYVGYYSIGGSLQPDLAIVDPHVDDEEEPFLEQKTVVDRQKRFSQEKLPTPMLGQSRGTSPVPNKVLVNGNSLHSPYPGDGIFAFENGPSNGIDDKSDSTITGDVNGILEKAQQPIAQNARKLCEVHNSQVARSDEAHPHMPILLQNGIQPTQLTPSVSTLPIMMSHSAGPSSECGSESTGSTRSSPNLRQRAASQQLLWTNSRTPSGLDSLKGRGHGSQEDLALPPLTPVLEVPTTSPTSARKGSEPKSSTEVPKRTEKSPVTNGTKKNTQKDDPAPPTPASIPAEKNSQRYNHGRSKANGGKPTSANRSKNNKKDGAESKTDQKPGDGKGWKKTKARKGSRANTKEAAAVKGSERKGG
ncbi:hypothetical protein BDD12DRAFT_874876 [Trichophaea hybrida]|nr:hypothetical protein BDD12DRAFT_874876 [Trichophaea hybrida]